MMNQILNPRWNSPLIRMFGLRIAGAAAPTLAPEIAPVKDVNQMTDGVEHFFRGEKICTYQDFVAAAVGNISTFQIRNPANSGILLVITSLAINCVGSVVYGCAQRTIDLTTLGSQSSVRDARWYNPASGLMRFSSITSRDNTFAAWGSHFTLGRVFPNTVQTRQVDIVLPPGWVFLAYTGATNQDLAWSVDFRERPFQPEELTTG